MESFEIYLKKERTGPYILLAKLILAVNLLFFLMHFFYTWKDLSTLWPLVIAIGIAAIVTLAGKYTALNLPQTTMGALLLFCITMHLLLGYWWVAITLLLLTALYRVAMRELVLKVSATHIDYPSFPRRAVNWSDLDNLILKDGLLTVDFRNNRVAQMEAIPGNWNEKEFNEFCRLQLNNRPGEAGNKSA